MRYKFMSESRIKDFTPKRGGGTLMQKSVSPKKTMPRLLVFDSGLGGLTVLRAIREAVPEAVISYLADDAGFPYGALEEDALIERVLSVVGEAITNLQPDAVVIACHTASTLALPYLRARYSVPFIGTVPAVKPAAAMSRTRLVSILATSATVKRNYTLGLIREHGEGCQFALVGSDLLATLAERNAAGERVKDGAISQEILPCFVEMNGRRTDVIVLACTHYPLLMERLERLALWPVIWLDPAPAIARRAANVLAAQGFVIGVGVHRSMGDIHFTSGDIPSAPLLALLDQYGLGVESCAWPDEEPASFALAPLWPMLHKPRPA